MAIKIYTYSGIRSPKKSSGRIGYVAEPDGAGRTLERYNVNYNQSEMLALYLALQEAEMKGGSGEIDIYTDNAYVYRALVSTIPEVARKGWYNSKGEPIKYADAWKAIWSHLKGKEYNMHLREDHEYKTWLIENTKSPCCGDRGGNHTTKTKKRVQK